MFTRLFFGEIQQGKAEEAWQILNEFAQRVKQQKGCVLNQVLQSGTKSPGSPAGRLSKTWPVMLRVSWRANSSGE